MMLMSSLFSSILWSIYVDQDISLCDLVAATNVGEVYYPNRTTCRNEAGQQKGIVVE